MARERHGAWWPKLRGRLDRNDFVGALRLGRNGKRVVGDVRVSRDKLSAGRAHDLYVAPVSADPTDLNGERTVIGT